MFRRMLNNPPSPSGGFGSIEYRATTPLAETMMSEIRRARLPDGAEVVVKVAIVDEEKMGIKLRLGNSEGADSASVRRFLSEHSEEFRQWFVNNRDTIQRRIELNQAAIRNEVERWLDLQSPGHPRIIRLYPVDGKQEGAVSSPSTKYYQRSNLSGSPYFLIAEYLPGGTLRDLMLRQKILTVEQALEMMHAIADILRYLHNKRFVHLDIKPQNIVFRTTPAPDGSLAAAGPTLIDLGIAAKEGTPGGGSASQHWAEPGRWQARTKGGLTVHRGMDIYSLGLILRYLLTGDFPNKVSDSTPITIKYQPFNAAALRFAVKPTAAVRNQVVQQLNQLIQRCLAEKPENRPRASDILQAVEQLQTLLRQSQAVPRWRSMPIMAAFATGVMALIAGAFMFLLPTALPGFSSWMPTVTPGVAAPTATEMPAIIVVDTATPQPTATPSQPPPTLVEATATEPPSTPTPLPPPTATEIPPTVPTATPIPPPTATPAPPTATPAPTNTPAPSPPTPPPKPPPTASVPKVTVTQVQRDDGSICGSTWQGRITIRWAVSGQTPLPTGYGYELVVWAPEKNEDPLRSPGLGATRETSGIYGYDTLSINPDLEYQIGVLLVQLSPYKRVALIGPEGCRFHFSKPTSAVLEPDRGYPT